MHRSTRDTGAGRWIAAFSALCALGCISTTVTRSGAHPRPERPDDCAIPLLTGRPARGFVDLGTIEIHGSIRNVRRARIELLGQGCLLGADAVWTAEDVEMSVRLSRAIVAHAIAFGASTPRSSGAAAYPRTDAARPRSATDQ